ncbi:MAG: hypothetical protein WCD21_23655 [Streptomyces sp.]
MLLPSCEKTELIEVVRLTDPVVNVGSADLIGQDVALWADGQTRDALALLAGIPDDELHRCFSPGWGIRGPGVPAEQEGLRGFASESPAAFDLLRRFRTG